MHLRFAEAATDPSPSPTNAPAMIKACTECQLTFPEKKSLRTHKRLAHSPPIPCSVCCTGFFSEDALQSHTKAKHLLKPCPDCQLFFPGKKELQNHKILAHPPPFSCSMCGTGFSSEDGLRSHIEATHPLKPCLDCQHFFRGKKALQKHRTKTHLPTFSCSFCSMSFPSKAGLQSHKEKTHTPAHSCKRCIVTFPSKKELSEHKSKLHSLQHSCPLCHTTFSTAKMVRAHQREMHPTCGVCKEKFLGTTELQTHQRKTDHLRCSECDILFDNRADHKSHVRIVQHTIDFRCLGCEREYECQRSLDLHCCDCDKVFLCVEKLESHFTNPSHLRKLEALANALLDEKEGKSTSSPLHICQTCKEMFPSKKSLKQHHKLAKHKPVRHIKCPVGQFCIKKFASPSALLGHLESGKCKSGMTRAKMTELVFAHDPNHYITSPDTVHAPSLEPEHTIAISKPASAISSSPQDRLASDLASLSLRIDDDDDLSDWSVVNNNDGVPLSPSISEWSLIQGGVQLTPTSLGSANISEFSFPASTHGILTPASHNSANISTFPFPASIHGVALSAHGNHSTPIIQTIFCHLCPPTRKPFLTEERLQAHLLSPVHAPKIFFCPLSFMPEVKAEDLRKRKNFSTLSGLTQHLESGRCAGGEATYKKVIAFVEEQLEMLGFGEMKLLLPEGVSELAGE